MSKEWMPQIVSGKLYVGESCQIGENVTIDVAEEVHIGDRCVIPDHAYFGGRRVRIGDDFYGYTHWNKRLEIGLGRRDEEAAVLTIGTRSTLHDNKIDLATCVTLGNDVGLSPEVTIYTHFYWQSPLDGYPMRHAPVCICDGVIVGYRSCILPGTTITPNCVIGAQSVVMDIVGNSDETEGAVYAGNPAKWRRRIIKPSPVERAAILDKLIKEYVRTCTYRKIEAPSIRTLDHTGEHDTDHQIIVRFRACVFDFQTLTVDGEEDQYTDDFRTFLFKRGVRFYTRRPFCKMGRA